MRAKFPYKWPLALDLLKQQYDANKAKRLLSTQASLYTYYELGPNIEYTLLGATGFLTFDPENLEAIFSTHFEGLHSTSMLSWRSRK